MFKTVCTSEDEGKSCELRFLLLFHEGRALAFPCNAHAWVDLHTPSERARVDHFVALATAGRDYSVPLVLRRDLH